MSTRGARRNPRILVSNDDGIDAPGLRALVKALAEAHHHGAGDAAGNGSASSPSSSSPPPPPAPLDIYVCAPASEQSAKSHSITLDRHLTATEHRVEGARAAYGVHGTPADAVMLALNSPLFGFSGVGGDGNGGEEERGAAEDGHFYPGEGGGGAIPPLRPAAALLPASRFDLVVSGINRGDNCGLHTHYSGTVGAAREGSCKGVPALALSVNDHGAREEGAYAAAARASAALVLAALAVLRQGGAGGEGEAAGAPSSSRSSAAAAAAAWSLRQGLVLNVNFPRAMSLGGGPGGGGGGGAGAAGGIALCHQGTGCIFPAYKELAPAPAGGGADGAGGPGATAADAATTTPTTRVFRAFAGGVRHDDADWCDTWAVRLGWTSVTPLSLRQDLRLPPLLVPAAVGGGPAGAAAGGAARDCEAQEALAEAGLAAASEVVRRAAAALGLPAGGHLLPPL